VGLTINAQKKKIMAFAIQETISNILIENIQIKNVADFVYLGRTLTWVNDCTKDLRARIAEAKRVMAGFSNVWKSKQIGYKTKINILETCVFSVALFACETWTLKKTDKYMILVFEMHCYSIILQVRWTQKVTNVEIRKCLNAKENLLHTY